MTSWRCFFLFFCTFLFSFSFLLFITDVLLWVPVESVGYMSKFRDDFKGGKREPFCCSRFRISTAPWQSQSTDARVLDQGNWTSSSSRIKRPLLLQEFKFQKFNSHFYKAEKQKISQFNQKNSPDSDFSLPPSSVLWLSSSNKAVREDKPSGAQDCPEFLKGQTEVTPCPSSTLTTATDF